MRDAVALFSSLSRREARRVGASAAICAFACTAACCFAALLGVFLCRQPAAVWLFILLLALPCAAAFVAFLTLGNRRPNLPRLLYRLDAQLSLDARLSSLLELQARGAAAGYIAVRLFRSVQERRPAWSQAYKLSRQAITLLLTGSILFSGLIVLAPFALRARQPLAQAESLATAGSQAPADTAARNGEVSDESPAAPAIPTTEESSSGQEEAHAAESEAAGIVLVDLLSELRSRTEHEIVLEVSDEESPSDGPTSAASPLDRLAQQLASASGPLSEEDVRAVRDAAASGPSDVAQKVNELLESGESTTLRQELLSLLKQPEAENSRKPAAPSPRVNDVVSEPTETGGESAQSDTSEPSGDTSADAPQGEEEQETALSSEGTLGDGSEAPATSQAEPGPSEDSHFVVVAPPAAVSGTGPVAEYLTRGVPVEGPESETSEAEVPAIDFARVDSILSTRSVPTETLETIRDYFERITQGEP